MVGNNYTKIDMSAQPKRTADHGSRHTNDRRKSDQKPKQFDRGSKFQSPQQVKLEQGMPSNDQRGQSAGGGQGSQNKNRQPPPPSPNKGGDADSSEGKIIEKKFTGRCRLFVGNLPNDTTEDEFKKMFSPFGQFTEIYLNTSRGFGFIRMDTRQNAENAKAALDGFFKKGRLLRVRFATHGAALRVKYLSPCVSNELLEKAFSMFGEIERAIVIVDDRGKSTGEGIVEFARKPGAQAALRRVNEGVFLLSASPRPIVVEMLEQKDEVDGLPEKFMSKNPEFAKERDQAPRFAQPGSFEFEFGQKWKDLYTIHHEQEENLKRDLEESEAKLEMDMSNAQLDHQANMLRQDLLRRQDELRKLEEQRSLEMQRRMDMRRMEDDRRHQDSEVRRQDLEMRRQQVDGRRHQQLLAQQERAMREMRGEMRGERGNAPPLQPPPAPPASMGLERPGRSQPSMGMNSQGHNTMGGPNISSLVGGQTVGAGGIGPGTSPGGMQPGMQNAQMRQSRFDQPPSFQSNMGPINNMGQHGGNMVGTMGNQPGMQQISNLMGGGPMGMGLGAPNIGQRGAPMGNDRGIPMGNDRGMPMGSDRGGPMGSERGPMGGERGPMGGERGPMGSERGPMGGERGPMGGERGPMGNERGMDRSLGRGDRGRDDFFESKRPRRF